MKLVRKEIKLVKQEAVDQIATQVCVVLIDYIYGRTYDQVRNQLGLKIFDLVRRQLYKEIYNEIS